MGKTVTAGTLPDFLDMEGPEIELPTDEKPKVTEYIITPDGKERPATVEDRIAKCGALRHKGNPRTGEYVGYYQKCDIYRLCPYCKADKADKERTLLGGVVNAGENLYKLLLEDDDKRLKTIPCERSRRFPREGGRILVYHTDEEIGGYDVDIYTENWEDVITTPTGRNISGKLGRKNGKVVTGSKKDKGKGKSIMVRSVVVDDEQDRDKKQQRIDYEKAWEEATLATLDLNPTLEDVQKALLKRQGEFEEILRINGYIATFSVKEFEWVYEDDIDWSPYNNHIREKYEIEPETVENLSGKNGNRTEEKAPSLQPELIKLPGQSDYTPF